jgi:hypothetical protein
MKTSTTLIATALLFCSYTIGHADNNRQDQNDRRVNNYSSEKSTVRQTERTTSSERNQGNRHSEVRLQSDKKKVTSPQQREFHQPCSHCEGKGYAVRVGVRKPVNCSYCNGRGFRVHKEYYLGSLMHVERYSISDIARIETSQLDAVLGLNRRQWDRIYRINFSYLTRKSGGRPYSSLSKEREIRNELTLNQRLDYAYYLEELHRDRIAVTYKY